MYLNNCFGFFKEEKTIIILPLSLKNVAHIFCWEHSLQVYSILRHVAEVLEYTKDEQLESLYQRTAWVFDKKYNRPGYGAYDVFKQAVS